MSTLGSLLSQAPITAPVPVNIATTDTNYTTVLGLRPDMYVGTAINILLGVSGVASFVFLLWGGLQWITAGGDKDGVEKARKKIMQALIGLVIVFSGYAIIFILRTLFNVEILGFTLKPLGT